ncbi:amidase family protein [Streptodolium elevatio]|uniref:Amidase family protein n=1 Tax=Streptodolium elevatio TaxID=3157996 RepID=A0ABV3DCE0_9ACTN
MNRWRGNRPAVDHDAVLRALVIEGIAIASTLLMAPRTPDPAQLEAVSRQFLKAAREASALDLLAAFDAQNRVTRAVAGFFTAYDLLVTPTLGRLPAPHGTLAYDDPYLTVADWFERLTGRGSCAADPPRGPSWACRAGKFFGVIQDTVGV